VIALSCAAFVAALVVLFCVSRKRRAADSSNVNAENADADTHIHENSPARNPNKDKMIASVVVDMRMNDPNLQDVLERVSETDVSMTDTEGAGTIVSNLSISEPNTYSIDPLDEEGHEVHIDPLAPPGGTTPSCIVRRRNIHDTHQH